MQSPVSVEFVQELSLNPQAHLTGHSAAVDWQHLTPLYPTAGVVGDSQGASVSWLVSPQPFTLSTGLHENLQRLGPVLWRFQWACDQLYRDSVRGHAPAWIATLCHQGKPESLITLAHMKRFRRQVPRVIRPDLLLQGDDFAITELDSVPGGLGFLAMLQQAYRRSGFGDVLAPDAGLPLAFYNLVRGAWVPECSETGQSPAIAVVISDEAGDYRTELQWLCNAAMQAVSDQLISAELPPLVCVHPKDLQLMGQTLGYHSPDTNTWQPIGRIYRFFELFDLPNIPNAELIAFSAKKGWVTLTPPCSFWLEEKLWLALAHHPVLQPYWRKALGEADWDWLRAKISQGWVLDPSPLPPQAVLPNAVFDGVPLTDWAQLGQLSQKQRQLVVKPSGFSPLAWGSRGVTIGHDVSQPDWAQTVDAALQAFPNTPHVLQQFQPAQRVQAWQMPHDQANTTDQWRSFEARVRLCPYYFADAVALEAVATPEAIAQVGVQCVGALATLCPADKKIIHGMASGVMAPASL